jgi:TonB family protein
MDDPAPADTSETMPASIPGRIESPEPPPTPTVAPPTFTTPIHEPTSVRTLDNSRILDREGLDGVLNGIGKVPNIISGIGDLDRVPRATAQISPDYPSAMRQIGESGSVTVEFVVDTSGRVIRAEAIRFSRREFVEPAVRAVLKWHFEPGMRNGQRVPFRMAVPIEFNGTEN